MTKTHAENAPSDALTAWRKAFFTRNVKAFAEGFAHNVVLEASALRKSVEGRDRVRQMLWTAAEIYESLVFTDQASSGQRISIEWGATAFGGKQLRGSTILVTNEEGKIDHAVVQHRPLDGLLAGAGVIVALMGAVAVAATLVRAADARDRDPCLARPSSGCWGHRACGSARLGRWPLRRQSAGRPRLRSGVLRSLPQPGTTGPAGQARRAARFDLHRRPSRIDGLPIAPARFPFAMARHAVVDLAQVVNTSPPTAVNRLSSAEFAHMREMLAAAGMCLQESTASEQKLVELRATYEPFVSALAERIQVSLPPWIPPKDALDDWQTSAWDDRFPTIRQTLHQVMHPQ